MLSNFYSIYCSVCKLRKEWTDNWKSRNLDVTLDPVHFPTILLNTLCPNFSVFQSEKIMYSYFNEAP